MLILIPRAAAARSRRVTAVSRVFFMVNRLAARRGRARQTLTQLIRKKYFAVFVEYRRRQPSCL